MTTSVLQRAALAACVTLFLTGAVPAAAAAPDTSEPQQLVDAYLSVNPGGQQINDTDIAYDNGAFIVSVAPAHNAVLASPDCPSGWYCFYDGVNYTYPRGQLSDCGLQDLGQWGWRNRTESAHYNMSSGSATFINDATTDTDLFTISTSRRLIADVAPNRNRADVTYRSC
jgi:hypothetical protein